jgi:hypothetical protein
VQVLGEGLGAFGDLMKVSVAYEGAEPQAPERFVAKFAPQGRTALPKFVVRQTFLSECRFYNDFTIEQVLLHANVSVTAAIHRTHASHPPHPTSATHRTCSSHGSHGSRPRSTAP